MIETMAVVLHHSKATAAAKLILLGIANHDGDGGAWPSVATLARYGNCKERQVQYHISQLIELGELRRLSQAGGPAELADHRRPNRYQVLVKCPPTCDGGPHHRPRAAAVRESAPGADNCTPPGAVICTPPVQITAPEPSLNRHDENAALTYQGNVTSARPRDDGGPTTSGAATPRRGQPHDEDQEQDLLDRLRADEWRVNSIEEMRRDRRLPFTTLELIGWMSVVDPEDSWVAYLTVKAATEFIVEGVHNPRAAFASRTGTTLAQIKAATDLLSGA